MTDRRIAWSSDEDTGTSVCPLKGSTHNLSRTPKAPGGKTLTSKYTPEGSLLITVSKLQSVCLGILGEHLEELLQGAAEILPFLPSHFKAVFLSIARRKQLLYDRALGLLCDEELLCLDCHATSVSEAAIRRAIEAAPGVRHVDLTGCTVGPATLKLLRHRCPGVEILRIGSDGASDDECAGAVKRLLPLLDKAQHADVDSWEALATGDEVADMAASSGRLMRLRCLVWPRMPSQLQQYCRANCPQVVVNPSGAEVTQRGLPPEFDPGFVLDDPVLQEAGLNKAWWSGAREGMVGSGVPVVHIAEKFRLAYVEQAQRLRERAQRADRRREQQRRRDLRRSPAEMAIGQWLDET